MNFLKVNLMLSHYTNTYFFLCKKFKRQKAVKRLKKIMLKHRKINPTLTKTKVGTISSRKVLIKKSKDGHPQHLFSMNYKFGKLF